MAATHRRYTKKAKIGAVVAAELTSNLAAAEATGIPESNIRRWRDDPEMAKYCDKTRDDLVEGAGMMTHRVLERISQRLDEFEPRDLTVLFGVMVDKAQLLSGGATGRIEARDISGTISDLDVIAAIREADAITSAAGAHPEDPGTPEGEGL